MSRAYWVGVTAAAAIGSIVGFVAGRVAVEAELREEYKETAESLRRSFEKAKDLQTERPIDFNEVAIGDYQETPGKNVFAEGISVIDNQGTAIVSPVEIEPGDEITFKTEGGISYHKAIAATETPIELFVDGGMNDYGMAYIEEEEYLEDDGRFKGKIDILMDDHNPVFLMDGQPIDDWDKRVGDSILVDFYKLVPPGAEPVLYVRNHRTDEDYEVVRVSP